MSPRKKRTFAQALLNKAVLAIGTIFMFGVISEYRQEALMDALSQLTERLTDAASMAETSPTHP